MIGCLATTLLVAGCTASHPTTRASAPTGPGPSGSGSGGATPSAPGSSSPSGATGSPSASQPAPQLALGATTVAARLPAALSRLVAVPAGQRILLLGGLDTADHTTSAVNAFDPGSGSLGSAGKLALPAHDAAGAVLGGRAMVVGGGAAASVDAAQAMPLDATAATVATVTGHLPKPRSDDSVATANGTMYVVGGYDGSAELPDVLATTDGATFQAVAQLAETVRYTAAMVDGTTLWVFGGEHHGTSIDAVQRVDLATHKVTIAAHLPKPLAHEAIVQLGGKWLLIGGVSRGTVQNAIYQIDPSNGSVAQIGSLPVATSDMGVAAVGDAAYVFGGEALTAEQTIVKTQAIERIAFEPVKPSASGQAAGQAPFSGKLLIADRGNNRLVLVDASGKISWTFPNAHAPAPPSGFYFPDDAFFVDHGSAIISNQEGNDTIVEISYPAGKPLWSYGHPGTPGTASGYLNDPDDAYKLADGRVIVADANNCRVVVIGVQGNTGTQLGQIGRTGSCSHSPPASLGYPNGDTPLRDGNVLVSEVHGSWVSEYTLTGHLVWTVHVPVRYPSDPQQIGPDKYIVADYSKPGGVIEFDREGHVLWDYHVPSGHGMLDHPSLAEVLPSGLICVNDDYRHRVVMIDPTSNTIAWQYGLDDVSGTSPGLLNTPDGFDLLAPDGTAPTHPWTG